MCPNIKLIGFSKEQADELIPAISEEIKNRTKLAKKAVITNYPGSTCVSADDITKPMPYFRIDNTEDGRIVGEFEQLTNILKQFGFDIEWGDIRMFYNSDEFKEQGERVKTIQIVSLPISKRLDDLDGNSIPEWVRQEMIDLILPVATPTEEEYQRYNLTPEVYCVLTGTVCYILENKNQKAAQCLAESLSPSPPAYLVFSKDICVALD